MGAINLAQLSQMNIFRNPSMDLWQRNTTLGSPNGYKADGFFMTSVGALATSTERALTSPNRMTERAYRVNVTTADASVAATDYYFIKQRIEGFIARQVYDKNMCLGFWVRTNKSGTYHFFMNNNSVGGRVLVMPFSVVGNGSWQFVKLRPPPIDTTVGTWLLDTSTGIEAGIALVAGTNFHTVTENQWHTGYDLTATSAQVNFGDTIGNYFEFTQIQCNSGNDLIPFEKVIREPSTELALNQRYFQKSYRLLTSVGAITTQGAVTGRAPNAGTSISNFGVRFPVVMRGIPVCTAYSTNTGAADRIYNSSLVSDLTPSYTYIGEAGFFPDCNGFSGENHFEFHWTASAEL